MSEPWSNASKALLSVAGAAAAAIYLSFASGSSTEVAEAVEQIRPLAQLHMSADEVQRVLDEKIAGRKAVIEAQLGGCAGAVLVEWPAEPPRATSGLDYRSVPIREALGELKRVPDEGPLGLGPRLFPAATPALEAVTEDAEWCGPVRHRSLSLTCGPDRCSAVLDADPASAKQIMLVDDPLFAAEILDDAALKSGFGDYLKFHAVQPHMPEIGHLSPGQAMAQLADDAGGGSFDVPIIGLALPRGPALWGTLVALMLLSLLHGFELRALRNKAAAERSAAAPAGAPTARAAGPAVAAFLAYPLGPAVPVLLGRGLVLIVLLGAAMAATMLARTINGDIAARYPVVLAWLWEMMGPILLGWTVALIILATAIWTAFLAVAPYRTRRPPGPDDESL